jgi:hypothetical protein
MRLRLSSRKFPEKVLYRYGNWDQRTPEHTAVFESEDGHPGHEHRYDAFLYVGIPYVFE